MNGLKKNLIMCSFIWKFGILAQQIIFWKWNPDIHFRSELIYKYHVQITMIGIWWIKSDLNFVFYKFCFPRIQPTAICCKLKKSRSFPTAILTCYTVVHAIFLLLFWQEFESHDGGLSQDKWVFYFNDKAEKERFLKALSDIWIKFFQVQWTYMHEYKGQILSCSAHVQCIDFEPYE